MSDGSNVAAPHKPIEQMSEQEQVLHWESLQQQLASIKEQESAMRARLFGMKFENPKEGTNTFDYGDGYKLVGKHVISRKFKVPEGFPKVNDRDPTIVDAVDSMIDELRAEGNEGTFVADRIVKWTPSCSESEYKKLSDTQKKIVDKYLETKPGSPQLEFKRPKTEA